MKLKIIMFSLFVVLFMCDQGYCLFRDDISSQQVFSAIKIQRVKDEPRKKQAEQVVSQTVSKPEAAQDQPVGSSLSEDKTVSKKVFVGSIQAENAQSMLQYKRFNSQGMIVETPQPLLVQPIISVQEKEKKHSKRGFILLFLIVGVVGVMVIKQQKNK